MTAPRASRSSRRLAQALCAALALAASAFVPAVAQTVTVKGSDTLLILNQEWADAFTRANPGIKIEVQGGGSGRGISALLEGSVDLAASSRPLKQDEIDAFVERFGSLPLEVSVAMDGVGIYVHGDNQVTYLSIDQLEKIFKGEITNWKQVGGADRAIVVYTRNKQSGTYEFMREHVLKNGQYSPRAVTVATTPALIAAVGRTPSAVGYGGIAYGEGARVIRVRSDQNAQAIWPTQESIVDGTYPLSRPLFLYVNPARWSAAVEKFLQFAIGPEGQKIVSFVGYYPIPDSRRTKLPRFRGDAPAKPAVGNEPKNKN